MEMVGVWIFSFPEGTAVREWASIFSSRGSLAPSHPRTCARQAMLPWRSDGLTRPDDTKAKFRGGLRVSSALVLAVFFGLLKDLDPENWWFPIILF